MVELPRYVRRVTARGRVFFYYQRGRGTPDQWPAIALPDPFDADFAPRLAVCGALERTETGFRMGGRVLPEIGSKEFWKAASDALSAQEAKDHLDRRTFKALVATFEAHDAFTKKADSTRRHYEQYGKMVIKSWGDDLVSELTTVDAQQALDVLGDTPGAANQFRAYLSRLVAFGIPRGFSRDNPIEHTEKNGAGDPWPSWPDWAFKLFFEHAPAHLALPAVSALFTGQRQTDVLAMPRPRVADSTIPVRAQKTGEIVWIPIHSEYRRWIAATPAVSVKLHVGVGATGRPAAPYTADGYRAVLRKFLQSIDLPEGDTLFDRFKKERIVFHGLRKNAVIMLLEAGCTEPMVGAIVNMSEQMVRHYGRDVRVRELARQGMKLLEGRWADLRPLSLPKAGTSREP